MEIYRDIEGYSGLYQVSNLGNVKSLDMVVPSKNGSTQIRKGRVLKPSKAHNGYLHIMLCKDGNRYTHTIHRLVAETFLPNPDNLPQVNHRDENKENNTVDNLEYCTAKYNINYGTAIERLSKKVLCVETGVIYPSIIEVNRQLGYDCGHISACCNGKRKSAYKYHWKYA